MHTKKTGLLKLSSSYGFLFDRKRKMITSLKILSKCYAFHDPSKPESSKYSHQNLIPRNQTLLVNCLNKNSTIHLSIGFRRREQIREQKEMTDG